MITLDGIFENVIAEVIVALLSLLISVLKTKDGKKQSRFDSLTVAILFFLFSVFNLALNLSFWKNDGLTVFLMLTSMMLGFGVWYIQKNQCPRCKQFVGVKKKVGSQEVKKFQKPWKYQPTKLYLYSDGQTWKKQKIGKEKTRLENCVTMQEFYECSKCSHKWDSGHFDVNLDERTRPKPEIVRTSKKNPNEQEML